MINEKEEVPTSQKLLDGIVKLMWGFGRAFGWLVNEFGTTIRLFGISPMFGELALAVVFVFAYHFPSEDTRKMITFAGTEFAIPFILGVYYATINMLWVATHLERDALWYFALIKSTIFPAALAWAVFSNQGFQELVGWGDPASTLRFCVFLVWGVVIINALIVQTKKPT